MQPGLLEPSMQHPLKYIDAALFWKTFSSEYQIASKHSFAKISANHLNMKIWCYQLALWCWQSRNLYWSMQFRRWDSSRVSVPPIMLDLLTWPWIQIFPWFPILEPRLKKQFHLVPYGSLLHNYALRNSPHNINWTFARNRTYSIKSERLALSFNGLNTNLQRRLMKNQFPE